MLLLIKRLLGFSIPSRKDPKTPTLRVTRNDPGRPRTRSSELEARPRDPVPPQE